MPRDMYVLSLRLSSVYFCKAVLFSTQNVKLMFCNATRKYNDMEPDTLMV